MADENKKTKTSSSLRQFMERMCNYILPLILLFAYVAVAAGIYYAVEKDCESHVSCPAYYLILEKAELNVISCKQKSPSSASAATIGSNCSLITEDLEIDKAEVVITKHSVKENRSATSMWFNLTYWSAFHFMAISVTTIGYGDIYPCSDVGQFLTVISCVLGIPMTLITVARLCRLCEFMYHLLWAAIIRNLKKDNLTERDQRLLDRKYYVPLWIGLPIPALWLMITSVYFYVMLVPYYDGAEEKKFTFFTSFYFTMISFLTIGFGDYAPENYTLIIFTFLFILIGLSLVTMGANSVQAKLELMYVDRMEKFQDECATILHSEQQHEQGFTAKQDQVQELQDKHDNSFAMKVLAPFAGKVAQQQLMRHMEATMTLSTASQASLTTYERGVQVDLNFGDANDDDEESRNERRRTTVEKRNVKFQVRMNLASRRSTVADAGATGNRRNNAKWSHSRNLHAYKSGTFKSKIAKRQLTT